jgi:hypothetical protein
MQVFNRHPMQRQSVPCMIRFGLVSVASRVRILGCFGSTLPSSHVSTIGFFVEYYVPRYCLDLYLIGYL